MRKLYFFTLISIFLTSTVLAQETYHRYLTASQIERLRHLKELLADVDTKPIEASIIELEKSRHPLINLEMKEAEAHAYTDIVKDYNIQKQAKKEWIYSMVCLNMAYLQFGGDQGNPGSTSELNRLIRKELSEFLPADFKQQLGSSYTLG